MELKKEEGFIVFCDGDSLSVAMTLYNEHDAMKDAEKRAQKDEINLFPKPVLVIPVTRFSTKNSRMGLPS